MNTPLFKKLCEASGAPAFEYGIRDVIMEEMEPLADEIMVDNIGNVIALVKGKSDADCIMCAAHMDEIGFMVRHIDDNGFIRILPLGGFDPKTLTAQRVVVHGKKDLPGCMGVKPIHVMSPEERTKMPAVTDYVVDVGMTKEEVEKYVSVGDSITRVGDLVEMGDCLNVKSIDNRGGCYMLIEAVRAMKEAGITPMYDFYAVFTVQEEVGLRGAQASTIAIQPTFAFALDVTIAFDTPGSGAHDKCTVLGKGVGIKVYDGTMITDSRMVKYMVALAEEGKIPYQLELLAAGGTDAGAMQKFVAGGSICGALSIPVRNVHQSIEMAHKTDVQASVDLLAACIGNLDRWDWSWKNIQRSLAPKAVEKKSPAKKPAAKKAAPKKK
ncbi:MAG: M42 family metallopeptidase [Akkermansia sp.]|nr:M42 family metallopeptidase [Akkermansia sp.]